MIFGFLSFCLNIQLLNLNNTSSLEPQWKKLKENGLVIREINLSLNIFHCWFRGQDQKIVKGETIFPNKVHFIRHTDLIWLQSWIPFLFFKIYQQDWHISIWYLREYISRSVLTDSLNFNNTRTPTRKVKLIPVLSKLRTEHGYHCWPTIFCTCSRRKTAIFLKLVG